MFFFCFLRPTLTCLRTVTCGYALSVTFVPGDRHLIVGMKDGKILIVDISSGDILEEIKAHQNEVWSTVLMPNQVNFNFKILITYYWN